MLKRRKAAHSGRNFVMGVWLAICPNGAVLADVDAHPVRVADKEGEPSRGRCKVIFPHSIRGSESCGYDMAESGSFELWPDPPSNFYVAVDDIKGDWAHAYTNGGESLGKVRRRGACWVNKQVRICLWQK